MLYHVVHYVQAKLENLSPSLSQILSCSDASGHSNSIPQLPCTRTHHSSILPCFSHSNCDHVEGEASGTGPSSPAKDPVVPPIYDLLQPTYWHPSWCRSEKKGFCVHQVLLDPLFLVLFVNADIDFAWCSQLSQLKVRFLNASTMEIVNSIHPADNQSSWGWPHRVAISVTELDPASQGPRLHSDDSVKQASGSKGSNGTRDGLWGYSYMANRSPA